MLNVRQRYILRCVAKGEGRRDARSIDLLVEAELGPGELTVLDELRQLADQGLVDADMSVGVGGRWKLTGRGQLALETGEEP